MGGPDAVAVRRSQARYVTRTAGLDSSHSFSFGRHYDPGNTRHGLLVANNEDVIHGGGGFDAHRHRDLEIVTWVLRGSLVHADSTGRRAVLRPGTVQLLSAGSGIMHSERNARTLPGSESVRLVQMWVVPDRLGLTPACQQRDIGDHLHEGLLAVASGRPRQDAAIRLHSEQATLHVGRLAPGHTVTLPDAPYLHLFVTTGEVELEPVGAVAAGDAVRVTGSGGQRLTARAPAEVLVWEMHGQL